MAKYLDYPGLKKYNDLLRNEMKSMSTEIKDGMIYVPSEDLDNTLSMDEKHGGLDKKSVKDFKDTPMTFSQMFDAILFPTKQPEVTQPSITIAYSGSNTIEVGTKLPAKSSISSTTSRGTATYGTYTVVYGSKVKSSSYAGEPGDVTYTIGGGDTLWETVSECKDYEVKASVTFADGGQPLDNKGGDATDVTAYSSSTKTSSFTINACYQVYATTSKVGTLTKQTLRTKSGWNEQVLTTVPENDGDLATNKFRIDVPSGWKVSAKQENPNKVNVYDVDVDLTKVGTTTYKDANNADVTYDIYTRTSDTKNTLTEGVKIKLTIS